MERRRLVAGRTVTPAEHAPRAEGRRRRHSRPGLVELAGSAAAERLRLSAFGRAYLAGAAILTTLILYLTVSGQVTSTAYEISLLKQQQAALVAEQDQLRYQEASVHTPARVDQEAAQTGMTRPTAARYVPYQPVAIDLSAPTGVPAPDQAPVWQRTVAALMNQVGASRDAMAADH